MSSPLPAVKAPTFAPGEALSVTGSGQLTTGSAATCALHPGVNDALSLASLKNLPATAVNPTL
jgi:hypothetical protein